jgi:cysteine-rich repeat protein
VDLLSAGSSPFDTTGAILGNYYLGVDPGPTPNPYLSYSFDILGAAPPGGTYEIRFAEVDNQLFLHQGIDNVSVTASLLEECDDGNTLDGDGCDANCTLCPPPGEISGLEVLPDGVTIQWDGGGGDSHDVVRAEGLPFGSTAEACIASETANNWAQDTAMPSTGSIFYYLVRGRNACGPGPYGFDSTGISEQSSSACP